MAVSFVCQWYPPEPVAIPEGIVHALQDEGMRVEVLTGVPNYPDGRVPEGYSAIRRSSEEVSGIHVHRTPLYPSHDSSAVRRLLNYASWALSSAVFGQGVLRRSDVSLVYSSPATAALPAMVTRALWKVPYVLLIQDVWPDSVFASGFLRGRAEDLIRVMTNRFVAKTYDLAAHIVVISPGMKTLLAKRGVPSEKITVVYNWLPEVEVSQTVMSDRAGLRRRVGLPDEACVFLYAGNHGKAQNLGPLVDAFSATSQGQSHLVLVGDGVAKRALVERSAASERVHMLGPVSRYEAASLARAADFNVVSLADEPLFAVTMPSKVQSGLASGTPMLVVARGDAAAVVQQAGAGVAAEPDDVASIRHAVSRLELLSTDDRLAMGSAGKHLYDTTMSRQVGAPTMAAVLRRVARSSRMVPHEFTHSPVE